jgi:hypothetical protein
VFTRLVVAILIALSASPALASGTSIKIPEPGDAALFVIAVIGLVVGRHASRRPPRHDNRPDDPQV